MLNGIPEGKKKENGEEAMLEDMSIQSSQN